MNTFSNTIGEVRPMTTTPEDVERGIDARMPPRWREHAIKNAAAQAPAVITYPACKSPTRACRGGRLPCPSPQACVQAEPTPRHVLANSSERAHRVLVGGVVLLLAVLGVVAVIARMGGGS